MAMNIDKMMTGIDKEFVDKRGKRLFVGDMIAFASYGDIKISQIIKLCNKVVITKYSKIDPRFCIKVNALFDEDELKQLNDKLVAEQKKEEEDKKNKIKEFTLVTFWKKGNDIGFTGMIIKSKPGSNIFTKKDIDTVIKKYEAKYPEYTFIYLNKDNTFTPYLNYKNLKLSQGWNSIYFYGNCWKYFELADNNDQLFFFKYEGNVDKKELAYTEQYYGNFGSTNDMISCIPSDYKVNNIEQVNYVFSSWNYKYNSIEEFECIWANKKKMYRRGILCVPYSSSWTNIIDKVKQSF